MDVLECVGNRRIDKVPYFDTFVTSASNQMASSRMEVNSANPILVTLARHDVLLVFEVPDFPTAVITGSGNYLLLCVKGHASNSSWLALAVRINLLVHRHALDEVLKGLRQVRIGTSILGPWSVLALNISIFLDSSAHPLLLHTCIDLLLDSLLMLIN